LFWYVIWFSIQNLGGSPWFQCPVSSRTDFLKNCFLLTFSTMLKNSLNIFEIFPSVTNSEVGTGHELGTRRHYMLTVIMRKMKEGPKCGIFGPCATGSRRPLGNFTNLWIWSFEPRKNSPELIIITRKTQLSRTTNLAMDRAFSHVYFLVSVIFFQ
jgi:hypothetical protein